MFITVITMPMVLVELVGAVVTLMLITIFKKVCIIISYSVNETYFME